MSSTLFHFCTRVALRNGRRDFIIGNCPVGSSAILANRFPKRRGVGEAFENSGVQTTYRTCLFTSQES